MSKKNTTTKSAPKSSSKKSAAVVTEAPPVRVSTVERDVFNMKISSERAQTISSVLVTAHKRNEALTMKEIVARVHALNANVNAINNHVRYMIVHDMLTHDAKNKTYSFSESARKLLADKKRPLFAFERKSK